MLLTKLAKASGQRELYLNELRFARREDSEIETVAREVIAADFRYIAQAYGFGHVDSEDLIATRNW